MEYSLFFNIFLLFATSVICLYVYFKKSFKYWDGYDIKVLPTEFPYGSLKKVILRQESLGVGCYNAYKYFKERKQKHGAFFLLNKPLYMPIDPEVIKNLLIRDFEYFVDRSTYHNVKDDPLNENLLKVGGNEWKTIRKEVSPAFSVSKIKQLTPIFHNCCMALIKKLQECSEINKTVEINEIFSCYTSDVVGSSIFGIDINSLENPDCDFRTYSKILFREDNFMFLKTLFSRSFPGLAKTLGMVTLSKEVSDFFMKIFLENMRFREANNVKRNDTFQMLLDVYRKDRFKDETSRINKIAAQSFILFTAGYESSASTITSAIFELSRNVDIQEKLRKEVMAALEKNNNELDYDVLMNMSYLDKVVKETLRIYPFASYFTRVCTQDYKMEDCNLVIKKGVRVFISTLGLHHDPDYYSNPEVFDPDRFSTENTRPTCTFLPFGEGPRNCVAGRFGLYQIKMGIAHIIKNFRFTLNSETGTPNVRTTLLIHQFASNINIDFEKI